jgi:hypothetical protein
MWECLNCSEQIDDDLDVCWNCQTAKDGSPPEAYFHQTKVPRELADLQERMSRQSDSDLLRIVKVDFNDYRKEAIDLASAELRKRGLLSYSEPDKSNKKSVGLTAPPVNEQTDIASASSGKEAALRERMFRILNLIKAKDLHIISDFQEEDASSFKLKTQYAEYDHQTWLKYELHNDRVRMEITHLFGYLNFEYGVDANQLLQILSMNIPSFQTSSAYIGVRNMDGTFFVSLNTSPIFLSKWSDEDIAEALFTQLFDLTMGLIFVPPPPIKQFGAE